MPSPALMARCDDCGTSSVFAAAVPLPACNACLSPLHVAVPCDERTAHIFDVARDDFGVHAMQVTAQGFAALLPPGRTPHRSGARRMSQAGCFAFIRPDRVPRVLSIVPSASAARPVDGWKLPALLLVASIATTLFAGWGFAVSALAGGLDTHASPWLLAAEFSAAILLILLSHEMGHWYAARGNEIRATLPYLLPVPFLFGTMGAFIQMRSPPPDRDAMIKLGAAGPLAGLAATLAVLALSLPFSSVGPTPPPQADFIEFGDSLLMRGLTLALGPHVPPGSTLIAHPAVFAGWFGLLITSLNLLPGGQLDGGHVLRAYLSHTAQKRLSLALAAVLLGLGWFYWAGWYMWAAVIGFFAFTGNPGPTDEAPPPSAIAHGMAALTLVTLVLTFCPWPVTEL